MFVLTAGLLVLATTTPPPGPECEHGVPVENQSSPSGPDCPGRLVVHDATCTEPGSAEPWKARPNFHPGSRCHGENDPNGVMWFNGVYHLFFQDHVGGGTVGGHLASSDLVSWRRLPIAIWNNKWYDKQNVWTFSATLVNGTPTMVYPGLLKPNASLGGCRSECMTHSVALPANLSDPWLMDWMKPEYNPTVVGVNRDPSTAWQTATGEWRYTDVEQNIFSSLDFKSWKVVGRMDGFPGGECPDFFETPPTCAGCDDTNTSAVQPTHVHATTHYQLGEYSDGEPQTTGSWLPFANWTDGQTPDVSELALDGGEKDNFYASKSFWDPSKRRRILWGWIKTANVLEPTQGFKAGMCPGVGQVMTNTNSLPRHVTYDPQLQRLRFFPVPEMEQLRQGKLAHGTRQSIKGPTPLLPSKAAQSEVRVRFAVPTRPARLGVSVMVGASAVQDGETAFAIDIFMDFVPATSSAATKWTVNAGYNSSSMMCPSSTDGEGAERARRQGVPCPSKTGPLWLKAADEVLDFAVWTDNTVVEAFFMNGRSAWAIPLPCAAVSLAASGGGGVSVFADGDGATLLSATVFGVGSIVYDEVGPS